MDAASEIIRLHELYQALELKLDQEQKQNESLHRSILELREQVDESAMEKEVLERETDLLKDALVEKTRHISMQDLTLVEAQKHAQLLAASNAERGQVISALYRDGHSVLLTIRYDEGRNPRRTQRGLRAGSRGLLNTKLSDANSGCVFEYVWHNVFYGGKWVPRIRVLAPPPVIFRAKAVHCPDASEATVEQYGLFPQ
ncbi:hypothetical protein V2A60_008703 [Cordyceps javanica]